LEGCQSYARQRLEITDEVIDGFNSDVSEFLTQSNLKTAGEVSKRTHKLFDEIVKKGLMLSRTTWEKGQNL